MSMCLQMCVRMHVCESVCASVQARSPYLGTPNSSFFEALEGNNKREKTYLHMSWSECVLHHFHSTAHVQPYTRTSMLEGCCRYEGSGLQCPFAFFVSLSMPLSTRLLANFEVRDKRSCDCTDVWLFLFG